MQRSILWIFVLLFSCKTTAHKNLRTPPGTTTPAPTATVSVQSPDIKKKPAPALQVDSIPDILTNKAMAVTAKVLNSVEMQWSQKSGPGTLIFSSRNAETTLIEADADGVYQVLIEAVGAEGQKAQSTFNFTWDTKGPQVMATNEVKSFMPFSLDAVVGADAVEQTWTKISGPGELNFGTANASSTMISATTDGAYVIRFSAKDRAGNLSTADVKLLWNTTEPMIAVGNDRIANKDFMITALQKGASNFIWTKVSGPGTVTFTSPDAVTTGIVADKDGTYVIRLTARTNVGREVMDELTLNWDTRPPTMTAISVKEEAYGDYRLEVPFNSDAVSYKWSVREGTNRALFTRPTSSTTNVKIPEPGALVLQLEARDVAGNSAVQTVVIPGFPTPAAALDFGLGESVDCALLAAGVKCWGEISLIQGYGDKKIRERPTADFVKFNEGQKVKAVVAGGVTACVLLEDGQVICWGNDPRTYDEVPVPPSKGLDLGVGRKAESISAGFLSVCARLDDGSVKCWGDIARTLKTEFIALDAGRKAAAISVGDFHACAILDVGSYRCWGSNSFGQLGSGTISASVAPLANDNTPYAFAQPIVSIAAGDIITCAALNDGRAYCWGRNDYGVIVKNKSSQVFGPTRPADLPLSFKAKSLVVAEGTVCLISDQNTVQCVGPAYDPGNKSPYLHAGTVDLGPGRTAVKLMATPASSEVCVLLDDQTVKCWGGELKGYGISAGIVTMPNRPLPL